MCIRRVNISYDIDCYMQEICSFSISKLLPIDYRPYSPEIVFRFQTSPRDLLSLQNRPEENLKPT